MNVRREKRYFFDQLSEWLFPEVRRSKRMKRMKNMAVTLLVTCGIIALLIAVLKQHKNHYSTSTNPEPSSVKNSS